MRWRAFVRKLQTTSGTIRAEQFAAIKAAGYSDAQLVDITLTVFTNTFDSTNDIDPDFPLVR